MSKLVVILAFDGVTLSDVVAPADTFCVASIPVGICRNVSYEVKVASISGGSVRSLSGLTIDTVPLSTIDVKNIDILFVTGGGPPVDPPIPSELVDWLRRNASSIPRKCGICTGTFLLAEAGLLGGKRVTTHWQAAHSFQKRYEDIVVDTGSIFIRDGDIWTSAGFSTGTDLALALIEDDEGYDKAIELAKTLVLYLKRSGSQPQVSAPLSFQEMSDDRFSKLHAWIVENLKSDLSVQRLAEVMNMSSRNFMRRYKEQVGCTPTKTVEMLRLEVACDLLSNTELPMKTIASRSGFGDQQSMRRGFLRHLNTSPTNYRQAESQFGAGSLQA